MTRSLFLLRAFFQALLALVCHAGLVAQTLQINVAVNPPYSSNYINYFTDPTQVVIMLNNTSNEVKHIYFAGVVRTIDESVSVSTVGGVPWNAPPLDIPPGPYMLTGSDLQPVAQGGTGALVRDGISDEQLTAGVLPEGAYELCLTAYDYYDNTILSSGLSCSNIFTIQNSEPPVPISPACDEIVIATAPQLVIFNWIMPTPLPPAAFPEYNFRLVRLWDATNPQAALESSNDILYETTQSNTVLVYNQTLPALTAGQQYAWWVQATTSNGTVINNNGYMAPCTFTYLFDPASAFDLTYPFHQDTLPWTHLPVIAHFQPHPDTTGAFHSTLTKVRDGSEVSVIHRKTESDYIKWNSGPFLSQRFLLQEAGIYPGEPFTPEMANYINIYQSVVPASEQLRHGSSYDLSAFLQLSDYDIDNIVEGYVSGTFVSGMGKPVPLSPVNNLVVPMEGEEDEPTFPTVPLHFKTAENPVELFPPYPIWIIGGDGPPTRTDGFIAEKWRLQVSRNADLTDPDLVMSGQVGNGFNVNTSSTNNVNGCDKQCVEDSLYKEVTVNFTPQDTGWYYWGVGWLKDIDQVNGDTYHDCGVRRFRIEGDSVPPATTTSEQVPDAQCLANCRRTPTPGAEKLPVSNINVGDTVQVGLFKMRVQQISFSGGAATGEGLIDVPVMKAALRVTFTNARINAQKRLYDGTVNGLYDNAGVIPAGWTVGGSMAAGFNPQAAQQIDTYLNTAGRLVSQFAGLAPMGLPIGIDKELPDGRVVIGILGVQFTDTIARLCAGVSLPFASLGTNLGLGNMAVPFHPGGIGDVSEEGTLFLLGDINKHVSGDTLRFKGARFAGGFTTVQDSGTFIAWDCQGFRALTLDVEWRFSKDRLKEDLANGEDGPDKIIGSLKVRTGRAGVFGRIDFNKPFHMDGAKGWGFDVQEAWIDLASYMNPPEMNLSTQVSQAVGLTDGQNVQQPTWEGFYLKRALLRLPPEIQRTGSTERTSFLVANMIINGTGVTASIKAVDVIDVDGGSLDGWGYSIDTLQMDITANSFQQAGFKGQIRLPITDTLLNYSAMIAQDIGAHDHYVEFLLHPDGRIPADFLKAKMDLQPTSYLRAVMLREDTAAFAKVVLNGLLTIDGQIPGLGWMNFSDIRFQGLMFQTRSPYTNADDSGVFSLASPQKYMGGSGPMPVDDDASPAGTGGGFPISITRVSVERRNLDGSLMAGVGFDINLQLTGATNIFTATTRIAILGELNTEALHSWGHHSVELDSIGVSGETGAVKIQGGLRWYNDDATYGNGINGSAHAWFMKGALEIAAAVQFGNKDGMRYWFADAMIAKDNGFSPGNPFNIYGFGGGAWYHMRRTGNMPNAQQITDAQIANQDDEDYTPGLTLSAVTYVPDAAVSFGFQAMIVFGDGAGGAAYNGDVTAGMTFSTTGGVATAFMDGNVYFLSERSDRDYVPIHGSAHIQYDFPNDVFQANLLMYVSISSGMVTGTGANDLAGGAEILISPSTWHFFVGTPTTPIGLDFIGLFDASAYFMVGKDLPPSVPPGPEIMALLPANFFNRSGDVENASGVAFGARASMSGEPSFYLLKFKYAAEVGLDLLFRTTDGMSCDNTAAPGIHGWYAQGQVYAYLMGSVRLHVDLWFAEGDFEILELAAAAMLQGGFANPSWVQGAVGGHYSILRGCVSGSFTFPFEKGEPCNAYGTDALAGLKPIDDITPRHNSGMYAGSTPVEVGISCEALLNIRLDDVFQLEQIMENGSKKVRTFKLLLDKFELKQGTAILSGQLGFNGVKDQVILMPDLYLEPNTQHTLTIKVRVEERNSGTGLWATALTDGVPAIFDSTVVFKTGAGLQRLTDNDIRFSYPLRRQRFLLQDECRNATIRGRSDFSNQTGIVQAQGANRVRIYKMILTPRTGGAAVTINTTFSHWNGGCAFEYALPQLLNNTTYIAQLIARDSLTVVSQTPQYGIDLGNMSMSMSASTAQSTSLHGGMAVIRTRTINGYSVRPNEKLLYTYHFRTSAYNTLSAKAAAYTPISTTHTNSAENPPNETLEPAFHGEAFDVYDLKPIPILGLPVGPMPPLISMNDPNMAAWQTTYTKPKLYDYYAKIKASNCSSMQLQRTTTISNGFPFPTTTISDFPDNYIGIPPFRTVKLHPLGSCSSILSDSETAPASVSSTQMSMGNVGMYDGGIGSSPGLSLSLLLKWETALQVRKDYLRLQTITADLISHCSLYGEVGVQEPLKSKVIDFLNTPYKPLAIGNYKVKFFFQAPTCMPDIDTGESFSTTGIATFMNPTGSPLIYIPPSTGAGVGTGAMQINP